MLFKVFITALIITQIQLAAAEIKRRIYCDIPEKELIDPIIQLKVELPLERMAAIAKCVECHCRKNLVNCTILQGCDWDLTSAEVAKFHREYYPVPKYQILQMPKPKPDEASDEPAQTEADQQENSQDEGEESTQGGSEKDGNNDEAEEKSQGEESESQEQGNESKAELQSSEETKRPEEILVPNPFYIRSLASRVVAPPVEATSEPEDKLLKNPFHTRTAANQVEAPLEKETSEQEEEPQKELGNPRILATQVAPSFGRTQGIWVDVDQQSLITMSTHLAILVAFLAIFYAALQLLKYRCIAIETRKQALLERHSAPSSQNARRIMELDVANFA